MATAQTTAKPSAMDRLAKAIGAAQGGMTSGAIGFAGAVAAVQAAQIVMPWWGYILLYLAISAVTTVFPAIGAYLAPKNAEHIPGDVVPVVSASEPIAIPPAAAPPAGGAPQ